MSSLFAETPNTQAKPQNADKTAASLAFLPVLRSKTGENQPGAAPEHLLISDFFVLEPQNLISSNGTERGGGVDFFAADVSKKRHYPRHGGRLPRTGTAWAGFVAFFRPSRGGDDGELNTNPPAPCRAGIPRLGVVGFEKLTPPKHFALTTHEKQKKTKKHKNTQKKHKNTPQKH